MDDLHIISLITKNTSAVDNFKQSCIKNNINYTIINIGEKNKGWKSRVNIYIKELQKYDNDKIIILTYSNNIIIQNDATNIIQKFKSLNKPVIISTKINLFLQCEIKQFNIYPYNFSHNFSHKQKKSDYRYPCLNLLIGYNKDLQDLYNILLSYKNENIMKECELDDQCLFYYYYIKNADKNIYLDYNQDLFGNLSKSINRYEIKNKKLYNKYTKTFPSFLNFQDNAISYYNKMMTPFGYKKINIKENTLPQKSKLIMKYYDKLHEKCSKVITYQKVSTYNNMNDNDFLFYRNLNKIVIILTIIILIVVYNKLIRNKSISKIL